MCPVLAETWGRTTSTLQVQFQVPYLRDQNKFHCY